MTVTTRIDTHISRAEQKQSQSPPPERVRAANLATSDGHMPIIDSENVTNTLIEYITSSADTFPPVTHSAASPATPITNTPLCAARRSERLANQCGTHESRAMLANTRGPSMKPAWAATNNSAPSEITVTSTNVAPSQPGNPQLFDETFAEQLVHGLVVRIGRMSSSK